MKTAKFLMTAFVAAMLCSCSHRVFDFTVISTKNMPIGTGTPTNFTKGNTRVEGEDKVFMALSIPLGSPNLKTAIDRAIERYPGAIGLADGVVKTKAWWAVIVGETGYVVEGTPIFEANNAGGVAPGLNQQNGYNMQNGYNQQGNYNQQQQNTTAVMVFHDVKQGETMADIAKAYGCSIGDIVKWNQLSSTTITAGTKLKVYIK